MSYSHLIEKAFKCDELQREVAALTKKRDELKVENELLKQHGRAWREQAEKLVATISQLDKYDDIDCYSQDDSGYITIFCENPKAILKDALANYTAFKKGRGEL